MSGSPNAVTMARDACAALSEPQRIAFAIELVNGVTDINCTFHLIRLSRLAEEISAGLSRQQFERANG